MRSFQTCYAKPGVTAGNTKRARAMRKSLMQSRWSKLIPLAGVLALMTVNASAQTLPPINLLRGAEKPPLTPEEQENQKKLDDAYKSATKKIPERAGQNDPWATVRPTPADPSAKKKKQ